MKKSLFVIIAILIFGGAIKSQTHQITINPNQRVVSMQMTASEYNSWKSNDEFSVEAKRQAIIQDIYQKFNDEFDFIFLVLNETTIPTNFPYNGKFYGTSNAITGIGISTYNSDVLYCSAGRLKGVIALPQRDYIMHGPSLHELMHCWGNRIFNTMDWNGSSEYNAIPHWGFTGGSTAGQLGGFKQSTLQTNVGGNPNKYRAALFGGFANGGNSVPYSDLELYLMGLIPLTDVANFDVFSGITQKTTIGTDITEFTASKRVNYDNAKILTEAGGPRNPSNITSQKDFRLLIVLLTPAPPTEAEWNNLDVQSEWFGRPSGGGLGYINNFWEATKGFGTMETGNLLSAVRTSQITPPIITASGQITFCNGGSVTLSTTSTEPLQWYKDGNPIDGATSPTYTATQGGSYSVKAGIGVCAVSSLSPLVVTVTSDIPIPTVTASGPTTFCDGGSVTLTSNVSQSYTYLWSTGEKSQSIVVKSTGNYSVQLADNNGCISYASSSVSVLSGNLGTWTVKAPFGGTARYGAVGFTIGTKVYLLTGYISGYVKDLWEYDPGSNTWTQKASFGGTARMDAVGFSIGTKGYVGLGYDGTYRKDLWEYDPAKNAWTQKADFGGVARYAAVGFSIGSKGYVGTGNSGYLEKDFWEYDPVSNTWTQKASFGGTGRHSAVGFSIGTKGYLGTGIDGIYKNDFWEYDPINDKWTQKADFGGVARFEAVGFSMGTKGFIGTGSDGSYKNDFWEYDRTSNTWAQKASFGGTARNRAVGFSIDTIAYVGTGSNNYYEKDFWEFKIKTPSITANGPTTFCSGSNVILTSSSATSYLWSNSTTTQSITVSIAGNYSVTAIDVNGCMTTSSPMVINVNNKPSQPEISQNGNVLHSDGTSGNQWYNQNGILNGATNQEYIVSLTGDYYVVVTLSGCSSDPSNSVYVIPTIIEIPQNNRVIKVFPNPVSNEFVIESFGNNERTDFEIMNSVGTIVYKDFLYDRAIVGTESFAPGLYIIRLENGKTIEFKKLIKQ
jgi:hypothetical protein